MGMYLYTLLSLICTLYLANAQSGRGFGWIRRQSQYQVYWYVASKNGCEKSEKFSEFKSAYSLYKFTQYYRQPVMIINDPYVFNMQGDELSINKCISKAQENGDLQRRRVQKFPIWFRKYQNIRNGSPLPSNLDGPPYLLGGITRFPVIDQGLIAQPKGNEIAVPVQFSAMCRYSYIVEYQPAPRDLFGCAQNIQRAARDGKCGQNFQYHGNFQFGSGGGNKLSCGCCQMDSKGPEFDAKEYIGNQKRYNVFKIKDLNTIKLTVVTKTGVFSPGEPVIERQPGTGLIIWSYTDRTNLSQSTIDSLPTGPFDRTGGNGFGVNTSVPPRACKQSQEFDTDYTNIPKVVFKFNQMPDYDRVITWKGRVIYSYGYTNDIIYCIKWGQSLGKIDSNNYYTPEQDCSGRRWDSVEAYNSCRTRSIQNRAASAFQPNRYITPTKFSADQILNERDIVDKIFGN